MSLIGWERVDRNDQWYKTCLGVAVVSGGIIGVATGSFLGGAASAYGLLGGAAWGLAGGYLVCPFLVPAVKKKLEEGLPMTEAEVRSAAEALGRYASVTSAPDAIELLAIMRVQAPRDGTAPACRAPAQAARQILSG